MKLYETPMSDGPKDIEWLIQGATHLTKLASEYREAKLDMYRQSSPLFDAEIKEDEIPRGYKFTQKLLENGFGITPPDLETALKNPTDPFGEAAAMAAECDALDMDLYSPLIYDGFYPDDDDDNPDDDITDTMKYI